MIEYKQGIMFTLTQKKDEEGKVINDISEQQGVEFYDKLKRLFEDYGFQIDRYGDIEKMQYGLCKKYKKKWQHEMHDIAVEKTIINFNLANKHGVPMIKPVFIFDEDNK